MGGTPRGEFFGMPSTRTGKAGAVLFATFLVCLALFVYLFGPIQGTGGDAGLRGLAAVVAGSLMVWSGVGGGGLAAYAIARQGERSGIAYLAASPLAALVLLLMWELVAGVLGLEA
jgi:hypothetical protein